MQGNTTTTSRPPGDDCTGSGDETALVQAKINEVADGGTVTLSGTCRVPGELQIIGRKGLTVAGPVTLDGSSMIASDARHLRVQGGERITIRNLTILGARGTCRDTCGSAGYDREHGIAIESFKGDPLTDVVIDKVTIRGVHGDFVYLGIKGSDAPADAPNRVTIKNSTFVNSGRQGIAAAGAEDLRINGNHLEAAGRTLFDFEAEAGGVGKVTITDNDTYDYDNAIINIGCADRGTGVPLNRGPIEFTGNRIHDQRLRISTSCPEVSRPPVLNVGPNQENV
ncbi:MAG: right-handed parallel beta-helix repeat-containing protein [Acidimicrobiales bacterium]